MIKDLDLSGKLELLQNNQKVVGFQNFIWKDVLDNMKFLDIVGFQPMENLVDSISYFSTAARVEGDIPEIKMNLIQKTIQAEAWRFSDKNRVASCIDREILSTIMESCKVNQNSINTTKEEIPLKLTTARALIHRNSQRRPGNWIALNPETLKYLCKNDRGVVPEYKIYYDTSFPEDCILMGMTPSSDIDVGIIWSPYCFSEIEQSVDYKDTMIRHEISPVNPTHFFLINIKETHDGNAKPN